MRLFRWVIAKWRWWAGLAVIGLALSMAAIGYSRAAIARSAEGRIHEAASEVPRCGVALLLGCARILPNGRENLFLIEAWGFPARDVTGRSGARTRIREELARVKAVLDVKVLDTQPKFRGEPVPIVEAG